MFYKEQNAFYFIFQMLIVEFFVYSAINLLNQLYEKSNSCIGCFCYSAWIFTKSNKSEG